MDWIQLALDSLAYKINFEMPVIKHTKSISSAGFDLDARKTQLLNLTTQGGDGRTPWVLIRVPQ